MRVILAVIAILAFVASTFAHAEAKVQLPMPLARLQASLTSAAESAPGRVAMEIRDLATGYTSGINMNAPMPAASTIKIPIMVEVFRQMELGRFDLNRRVELMASDRDWGSGNICDSPVGSTFPVSTLLTQMITVSDNTAANMLIRLVGRRSINRTMHRLGLRHTHLLDYIRTTEWSVRMSLRTSPADMVRLLTRMARNQLIDGWSSRYMIAILEGQEINSLIPQPLPHIPIAHKTGSFDDTLNDVGIVYSDEPYVIAVMTTDLPSLPAGRQFIRQVSRVAYTRLRQFAKWRQNNEAQLLEATTQTLNTPAPEAQPADEDLPMWGPPAAAAPSPAPQDSPQPDASPAPSPDAAAAPDMENAMPDASPTP